MQNLKAYVESRNSWAKIFGSKQLSLQNAADRQRIAEMIDADLSPENLTCDGELSTAQVRAKHANLLKVARELKAFDPSVQIYELY